MRIIILPFLLFVLSNNSSAQVLKPANWSFIIEGNNLKPGDEVILKLNVQLEKSWQLYSTDQNPEVGPLPAEITFTPHPSYELIGNIMANGVKEKFDQVWQDKVRYLEDQGAFVQRVRILSNTPIIRGIIKYQLCTTIDGKCIYPEQDFVFSDIGAKPDRN